MSRIKDDVIALLSQCTIEGNAIKLPAGQLDRKLYMAFDQTLKEMGGKWNRKAGGHMFDSDPCDRLDMALQTGEVTSAKNFGYFPTPEDLAEQVIELANIQEDDLVLEPEAGQGALAEQAARFVSRDRVHCVELLEDNAKVLREKGFNPNVRDFLTIQPNPVYDVVVMNPPFAGQKDIEHVEHAYEFLKPGGRLVAIMSNGMTFRDNKKSTSFRDLVAELGEFQNNPESSFKSSGTNVNTITVVLMKPADAVVAVPENAIIPSAEDFDQTSDDLEMVCQTYIEDESQDVPEEALFEDVEEVESFLGEQSDLAIPENQTMPKESKVLAEVEMVIEPDIDTAPKKKSFHVQPKNHISSSGLFPWYELKEEHKA